MIARRRKDARGMLALEYALLVMLLSVAALTLCRFTADGLAGLFSLAAAAL